MSVGLPAFSQQITKFGVVDTAKVYQAYFRNSISQEEKFKNDAFYAENVSFILDVKVFFKTITSVFSHRNINSNADSDTIAETRENPVRSNTNK